MIFTQPLTYYGVVKITDLFVYRNTTYYPTISSWNAIIEAWNSDLPLKMDLFINFLNDNVHRIDSCQADCKWCILNQAVEEVKTGMKRMFHT